MKEFVTTLLDSYNVLVKQNDMSQKDFDNIKGLFSLYLASGNSFNVTVVQTDPNNVNWITLMFTPIIANQPNVTIDSSDFFMRLFPYASIKYGFDYSIQRNFVSTYYNGTVVRLYLILELNLSQVSPSTSDYIANANQIAQSIYQSDQSQVPTVSQTQIINETPPTITVVQSASQGQSPYSLPSFIPSSWGPWIVGTLVVLGAIYLVLREIRGWVIDIFGSWMGLLEFIIYKEERKRKIESVRQALSRRHRKQVEPKKRDGES
jgi:hypothetical protein